jgi:sulfite exporter TauE/SafE/copper chaperone CopZ
VTATTSFDVPVAGMTCRTCERRIERHLAALPDVVGVSASAVAGRVRVETTGPVPADELAAAIEAAGYTIGPTPWLSGDRAVWATAGLGLLVVVAIVALAELTGFTALASGAGDLAEGGLVVALLLGLAAGVSTCLALVGGLVLALSAAFAARHPETADGSIGMRLRPSAIFVGGRVVGFAVLGAFLGAVGASISTPPALTAVLMVAVALLMTLLGTRLTGISPRIAAWSPTLPTGLARALGVDASAASTYSDSRAAVLGAASFFLPCGFTQAVQVFALATGEPLDAGVIMGVFALGTAPGLLALGGLPNLLPAASRPALLRVIGVVVLGFALVNGMAGLRLLGLSPSLDGVAAIVGGAGSRDAPGGGPTPVVTIEDGVQTLRTFQVADGYLPADTALYAGLPTRWIVDSLEPRSCAVFLVVPKLDIAVTLAKGENVIDLPPLEPGTIAYTCSMGMYGGTLTVVEPQGAITAAPRG